MQAFPPVCLRFIPIVDSVDARLLTNLKLSIDEQEAILAAMNEVETGG